MRALVLFLILANMGIARAEPATWYDGDKGRRRLKHIAWSSVGVLVYSATETFLKPALAPDKCLWCEPGSFDVSIRDAVRWNDPTRARQLSDGTGFLVAPVTGLAMLVVAQRGLTDAGFARWLDDAIPVIESAVIAGLVNQSLKFSSARQRPFVRYADPARPPEQDDNLSFYSGHTTFAFAVATSASLVAHRRGYRLAPLIWASSYVLATSTAYLRLAGDKHYFSDVAVGAVTGIGIGIGVPLLLHPKATANVVPTGRGVALVGAF